MHKAKNNAWKKMLARQWHEESLIFCFVFILWPCTMHKAKNILFRIYCGNSHDKRTMLAVCIHLIVVILRTARTMLVTTHIKLYMAYVSTTNAHCIPTYVCCNVFFCHHSPLSAFVPPSCCTLPWQMLPHYQPHPWRKRRLPFSWSWLEGSMQAAHPFRWSILH
jgi:hypothetical protein